MKYHGCILEFTDHRNKELMRAFREALNKSETINLNEISEMIVNMPCSRFWVSEERALAVVSALIKGRPILKTMRPTKQKMFKEIYKRVVNHRQQDPDTPLFNIISKVVNSPAPEFYMTPRSAMETIYKIRKGFYKKMS